jgi:glucose/arabinose dehydrogenase
MRRAGTAVIAGALALVLAGCSTPGGPAAPTWVPSPGFGSRGEGPPIHLSPIIPVPPPPTPNGNGPGGGSGTGGPRGSPSSPAKKIDPLVVATHLDAPVGLAMLPDGTALVGERTTGRLVRVQPVAGKPVGTVRTLPGIDGGGDGGLLDLALSPSYDEDNLVYAYITTRTDNRVVDFTLTGPVTPVVTGIPKGRTGNTGRIVFGADGNLYIGTGDAGTPRKAANPDSLAGKVLRVSDIGEPARGNPKASSPVWTSGHHEVDGLCKVSRTDTVFEIEPAADGQPGEVNLLDRGDFFGWPTNAGTVRTPAASLPPTTRDPGGCAVRSGQIWVTSLDGTSLLAAPLTVGRTGTLTVGKFAVFLKNRYGRLRTVVAAPDGALWLTTSNRDGHGKPVAADERVIRYIPDAESGSGKSPA